MYSNPQYSSAVYTSLLQVIVARNEERDYRAGKAGVNKERNKEVSSGCLSLGSYILMEENIKTRENYVEFLYHSVKGK